MMDVLDGVRCAVLVRGADPVLRDHRVHGTRVLPGVSFLDMIYRVLLARGADTARAELRRVLFRNPVALPADGSARLRLRFDAEGGHHRVRVEVDEPGAEPVPVLECELHLGEPFPHRTADLGALRGGAAREVDVARLYGVVRGTGIEHGEFMRGRGTLHVAERELLADLELGPSAAAHGAHFHLHPAALDSATLLPTQFAGAEPGELGDGELRPYIPMLIDSVRARGPVSADYRVRTSPPTAGGDGDLTRCDLDFYDADGRLLLWLHGLTSKRVRTPEAIARGPEAAEVVRELVARRLDADVGFDPDLGFYELGLDSSALLGIASDLEGAFGTDFSPTLLFEHNTAAALAAHLREVAGPPRRAVPAAPTTPERPGAPEPGQEPDVVRFRPGWAPRERSDGDFPARVLLVGPCGRAGELVARRGAEPIAVRPGAEFARTSDGFALDPRDPGHWRRLLAEVPGEPGVLWCPADHADLEAECAALLGLVAELARRPGRSRLVYHLDEPDFAPVQALSALLRTLGREHPEVRAGVVRAPGRVELALAELGAQDGPEPEVRHLGQRREIRAFTPVEGPGDPARLRDRGVYLITGGLGGVGRALARALAAEHRARLVLCGRSEPDPAALAEITELGGEVLHVVADVTDPAQVRRAVARARERFGALHGVVHAAGVLRDGLVLGKSADDARAVLAPKVTGARNLAEAVRELPLDFLALCSSTAGSWGNPGQADYACANAFLDGFAGQVPGAVSIGWPAWAEGGMPVDAAALRAAGLSPLPTNLALRLLEQAIGGGEPHVLALAGDRRRILDAVATTEPTAAAPEPARAEPAEPDAIAIVGMSGRYPMAADLTEFWANLRAGRDCITEVPADRWDDAVLPPGRGGTPGSTCWGGFLDGIDEFDPAFFHISPNEAAVLDPQERLFLQTAWHAFEDAGHAPSTWRGRRVGVYVGVMYGQYQLFGVRGPQEEPGLVPSSFHASVANRVSYFLDLRGPSIALDTMCSSSLTAIHLAAEAVRGGECEAALAGGVNLTVHPNKYLLLGQSSFLSTDGRCRAFGAGGDGYVPGEGVGAVLLRPLRDALRDGDQVLGVIRGQALNHGGRTAGFSVPNPESQAGLITEALRGVGADGVGYVEAHGTGTALGDPIEIRALEKAFDRLGGSGATCPVGSVKSNVGHLESAAGIAAVTKVLLQLRHRTLVPSLHAEQLNPDVDWERSPFAVQREPAPWLPSGAEPLRAAISSFGAGGANAHLVLEEHPTDPRVPAPEEPRLFAFSARDADRLRALVERFERFLAAGEGDVAARLVRLAGDLIGMPADPGARLAELGFDYPALTELTRRVEAEFGVRTAPHAETTLTELATALPATAEIDAVSLAHTLWAGRDHFAERLAVVATGVGDLLEALRGWLTGQEREGVLRGSRRDPAPLPPAGADLRAAARAWTEGAELVDPVAPAARISLPGYPFERGRYWVDAAAGERGHPLAGEPVELPGGRMFRGSLLVSAHPWLLEHAPAGLPLLPATALAELLLHAGGRSDCPELAELVLERPVPLEGVSRLELRVLVGEGTRRRDCELHSRADGGEWTRHATAVLAEPSPAAPEREAEWPPAGAEPVDTGSLYRELAAAGVHYGPAFQGVRAAWRRGTEVCAEIALPAAAEGPWALHPALLDAVFHAVPLGDFLTAPGRAHLPFALRGMRLHARGARALRVRLSPAGTDEIAVRLSDADGAPVAEVAAVSLRPLTAAEPVHRLAWAPQPDPAPAAPGWAVLDLLGRVPALVHAPDDRCFTSIAELAAEAPELVLLPCPGGETAAAVHDRTREVLHAIQRWLAEPRLAASTLLVITSGAQAVGAEEVPDLAGAAVWGLLRSAQAEHPGRVALLDLEPGEHPPELAARFGAAAPQLAVRGGVPHAPRLREAAAEGGRPSPFTGTVLITGAGGALAGAVARHLVHRRGVASLVLAVRDAASTARLTDLAAELRAAGSEVELTACDVADRDQVRELLTGLRRRHRLSAVVHTAGRLDDGVLTSLDAERLAAVLRPKVDGALHLHEFAGDAELVLFSSMAGVLGGPGQANYAAANAFLDALARYRVSAGLPATALAWGPWEVEGGMPADRERMRRGGIEPLSERDGMRLLDEALARRAPDLVPLRPHPAGLRAQAAAGALPALLRELAPAPEPTGDAPPTRFADLAGPRLRHALSTLVRTETARVLGHPGPGSIEPDRSFQELGFDSLTAVEFRNRLTAAVDRPLPATLVFDHPTPDELTDHLLAGFAEPEPDLPALLAELERAAARLADRAAPGEAGARVRQVLDDLRERWHGPDTGRPADLGAASDDEVFALIDAELGRA
ncbi:SDR family NAD(P)-dependent oxidoreductase [Saccharopolyspora sp. MS10]|uniref:SDR family NAD(P)-dependent oxidoreductase n=1 Tax=Saccharopolyspora sp. MS10 TaxID=3385973 RepID=UPI0039A2A93A